GRHCATRTGGARRRRHRDIGTPNGHARRDTRVRGGCRGAPRRGGPSDAMNPTTSIPREAPRTTTATRARTMRAVVKAAAAPGAEIREVPVPTPGAGQLLLKVLRAGVC